MRLFVAGILVLAAGCAGPEQSVRVVDGVVTNPLRPDTFFTAQEAWRIGSLTDERTSFGRVTHVALSPEGEILIADAQRAQVDLFAATGNWTRTIGRRGQGPGELSQILDVGFADDLIWVRNFNAGMEQHFYDRAGEFQTSWAAQTPTRRAIDSSPTSAGWLATVAADVDPALVAPGAVIELQMQVWTLDDEGNLANMVREFPGSKIHLGSRGEGTRGPVLQPEPFTTITPRGEIVHGSGAEYAFEVVSGDGQTRLTIRREVPVMPVTEAHRTEFEAAVNEVYRAVPDGTGSNAERDRVLARRPVVESVPPLTSVIGTADGGFWALRSDRGDVVGLAKQSVWGNRFGPIVLQWDRFSAEGAYEGSFELPEGFTPHVWLERGVIGVQLDELDVPFVVRLDFHR